MFPQRFSQPSPIQNSYIFPGIPDTILFPLTGSPDDNLEMNLNDLLRSKGIDPQHVLVLRHRPHEPELNKVLPWLAAERPGVFNAYQQTQGERLERVMQAMTGTGYVASFIGREPGKALFVGLYSIGGSRPLSYEEFWQVPAYIELKAFGMKGLTEEQSRASVLWFDLELTDWYARWKGKLVGSRSRSR